MFTWWSGVQSFLKKKAVDATVKKLREIVVANSKSGAGGLGKESVNGATIRI